MGKMLDRLRRLIRRDQRKPRSKLHRITNRTITVLGIAYLCLVMFPNFLFAHSVRIGPFSVHSDRPISDEIDDVLDDVRRKIAASPFYSEAETFDIFIAEDDWRRMLLNPRASKASGAYFAGTGNIILNRCDIDADLCFSDLPKFNRRPMHSVIAHECTHRMIWKNFGYLRTFRLPTWKHEGYCEYIAGNPSFGVDRATELLIEGRVHPSITFRYACWLITVKHLIEDRGLTVDQLFSRPFEFETELDAAIGTIRETDDRGDRI